MRRPELALLAALSLGAASPERVWLDDLPHISQGGGPLCAVASVAMAGRLGVAGFRALSREVFVAADGVSWLDLRAPLARRGLEQLVVVMADAEELRATLRAGWPVVIAVMDGARKHAVTVRGFDAAGIDVLDPTNAHAPRWSYARLEAIWARRQAVVVRPLGAADGGAPVARWRAQDRRFRALEWGLRAERLPAEDDRALALWRRAVGTDPTIPELQNNLARCQAAQGHPAEACAALRIAARLDPAWPVPRANAAQLGCGQLTRTPGAPSPP